MLLGEERILASTSRLVVAGFLVDKLKFLEGKKNKKWGGIWKSDSLYMGIYII